MYINIIPVKRKIDDIDKLLSFAFYHMKDDEEWREVRNTNGKYFVSNKGSVLSLCRNTAYIMHPYLLNGYYYVEINENGQRK